jgi:hypothetical protein
MWVFFNLNDKEQHFASYIIMQTSLLLSFVIKPATQGREGVLRTTTKHMHTIYEEAW